MPLEQIIELLNSVNNDLSTAGQPPYIMKNNAEAHDTILDYLGGEAHSLLKAVAGGYFDILDEWLVWDNEMYAIYTFSTKMGLFSHISCEQIATALANAGIELTMTINAVQR